MTNKTPTLSDEVGFVHDYEIKNEQTVHPAIKQAVYDEEDVREFIKKFIDTFPALDEYEDGDYMVSRHAVVTRLRQLAGSRLTQSEMRE